jgi:hypothetical protein
MVLGMALLVELIRPVSRSTLQTEVWGQSRAEGGPAEFIRPMMFVNLLMAE